MTVEEETGVIPLQPGTPGIASNHEMLGEARKDSPLQTSEGAGFCCCSFVTLFDCLTFL